MYMYNVHTTVITMYMYIQMYMYVFPNIHVYSHSSHVHSICKWLQHVLQCRSLHMYIPLTCHRPILSRILAQLCVTIYLNVHVLNIGRGYA